MLVWSEAWNAKGEEGKTGYCLEHTPIAVLVPMASLFPDASAGCTLFGAYLHVLIWMLPVSQCS